MTDFTNTTADPPQTHVDSTPTSNGAPAAELTVDRAAGSYWVVRSGGAQLSGAVTREAAEAERELVRKLRTRTAQMRSTAPRRPRAVQRPTR